jgi:hypothetical protein
MIFDRLERSPDAAKRVLGIGHKLIDLSLRQARELPASVACFPHQQLERPLILFRVIDQVTGEPRSVRRVLVGVEAALGENGAFQLLIDSEVLVTLNRVCQGGLKTKVGYYPEKDVKTLELTLNEARRFVGERLGNLGLPFRIPVAEEVAVLWPGRPGRQEEANSEEESQVEEETFG